MNDYREKKQLKKASYFLYVGVLCLIVLVYCKTLFQVENVNIYKLEAITDTFPYIVAIEILLGIVYALPYIIKRIKISTFISHNDHVYATFKDKSRNGNDGGYLANFTYTDENGNTFYFSKPYNNIEHIPFHDKDQARVYFDPDEPDMYCVSDKYNKHPEGYDASFYKLPVTGSIVRLIIEVVITITIYCLVVKFLSANKLEMLLAPTLVFISFFAWLILSNGVKQICDVVSYNRKVS